MDYYDEIYSRAKDYLKERHMLVTHYEVGKLLNEAGGKYGDNIIGNYSKNCQSKLIKNIIRGL